MEYKINSFKYYWEDFTVGKEFLLGDYKISENEIIEFSEKFDPQYFHVDPIAAKESAFGGLVACGWHTCAIMMRLICDSFLTKTSSMGSPGVENLKWLLPLNAGDKITGFWKVSEKRESNSKPNLGIINAKVKGINQKNKCVISMEPTILVFKQSKSD